MRRFARERFSVWRCAGCRSVHAIEDVDLAHYYAGYPAHAAGLDWKRRLTYSRLLARLRDGGLDRGGKVLDYGCGSGALVSYLGERGYRASGYDRFAAEFADPATLADRYDCIVCQDVVEHVDEPNELMSELRSLLAPGGFVSVGTPDASHVDLGRADGFSHDLHQPYHRHLYSVEALKEIAPSLGLEVVRVYPTMYANTWMPGVNLRFLRHYLACQDDTFDVLSEPLRLGRLALWTPKSICLALFGSLLDPGTDVTVLLRPRP